VEIDISHVVSVQKTLRVNCKPSTSIMELKKKLRKIVGYPLEFQRMYLEDGTELKNHYRVLDLDGGVANEDDRRNDKFALPTLVFKIRQPTSSTDDLGTICFHGPAPRSRTLVSLMMEAQAGLAQKFRPELQLGGSAGTYVLRNQYKDRVACFKPADEEPRAPFNPRPEYVGEMGDMGLREGIYSGQGCIREVAAFLIDSVDHFHGVPYTCLCEASDDAFNYAGGQRVPKLGSLQQFIEHDTCMSDYSSSSLDVDEVHKIGLLDIRIMNVDRNDGNVLVSFVNTSGRGSACSEAEMNVSCRRDSDERRTVLTPIDHGYCFPDRIRVDPLDWCWFYWKQAKVPFSQSTIDYVNKIDVDGDADMLRKDLNMDLPSLRTFRICGRLMKTGVAGGLTLFDLGEMIAREDPDLPSRLELTVEEAIALARNKVLCGSGSGCSSFSSMNTLTSDEEALCDGEVCLLTSGDLEDGGSEIRLSLSPPALLVPSADTDSETSCSDSVCENDVAEIVTAPILDIPTNHIISLSFEKGEGSIIDADGRGADEDICSLPRATPEVPVEVLESKSWNLEQSRCKDSPIPCVRFDEDIWSNAVFEKSFFEIVETLIARDVKSVVESRSG